MEDSGFLGDWLSKDPSPLYYQWVHDPIPGVHLRTIFRSLIPTKKSSRKWEEKIDEKPSCYESYVHTVCGDASQKSPSDGGQGHATKCHFLKEELESWSSLGFHHSVHYEKEEDEQEENEKKKWGFTWSVRNSHSAVEEKSLFYIYWNRLEHLIEFEKCHDPYPELRIAEVAVPTGF